MSAITRTKLCLAALSTLVVGAAKSQEESPIDHSFEDDSGFYAECTAYYELIVDAVGNSGAVEMANVYEDLKNTAMLYAFVLALPGRDRDIATEVVNARIELYKRRMLEDVGGRNENLSILINRHSDTCLTAVQAPRESVELAATAAGASSREPAP